MGRDCGTTAGQSAAWNPTGREPRGTLPVEASYLCDTTSGSQPMMPSAALHVVPRSRRTGSWTSGQTNFGDGGCVLAVVTDWVFHTHQCQQVLCQT